MRKTLKYYLLSLMLVSMLIFSGCRPIPVKVEVPDLIGMEMENAIEALELASLNPDALKGDAASEKELENIVYFQAPDPGTKVKKNSIVTFTFYGEYIFVRPQRKISILWMGDEKWPKEMAEISLSAQKSMIQEMGLEWSQEGFGGTHIVGFLERVKPDWYEGTKVKLIMYLKTNDPNKIRDEVNRWKNHPNLGGYWLISGHEPDITGGDTGIPGSIEANKKLRREQYELIRELDPNKWDHPVVIFWDMTSSNLPGFPGWELAFQEGDHDLFLVDCYANLETGEVDYPGMEAGKRLVDIGLARSEKQFIPNLGAAYSPDGRPASVVEQWEWWKEQLPDISAVCFWHSGIGHPWIGIYEDEYLEQQAKEINRRLGPLGN